MNLSFVNFTQNFIQYSSGTSSSLGIVRGANKSSLKKHLVTKSYTRPWN